METNKLYTLPPLPYEYDDLAPFISEEQLTIHHQKHHRAYVNGANAIFEKLEKSRQGGSDLDMKAMLKELSFHIGGHVLHSLFWENMAPAGKGGGGEPDGDLGAVVKEEFVNFERFKKEFTQATLSIEGSGWSALVYDKKSGRPLIMQIEKHNLNIYPWADILMAVDFWEHAYYLDYKNERAKFLDAFWSLVNWGKVGHRLDKAIK